jgi:hypothetical protein
MTKIPDDNQRKEQVRLSLDKKAFWRGIHSGETRRLCCTSSVDFTQNLQAGLRFPRCPVNHGEENNGDKVIGLQPGSN